MRLGIACTGTRVHSPLSDFGHEVWHFIYGTKKASLTSDSKPEALHFIHRGKNATSVSDSRLQAWHIMHALSRGYERVSIVNVGFAGWKLPSNNVNSIICTRVDMGFKVVMHTTSVIQTS